MKHVKTLLFIAVVMVSMYKTAVIVGKDSQIKEMQGLMVEATEVCGYDWKQKQERD